MGEIPDVSSHLDIFPYETVDIFAMKSRQNIHGDMILVCTIYTSNVQNKAPLFFLKLLPADAQAGTAHRVTGHNPWDHFNRWQCQSVLEEFWWSLNWRSDVFHCSNYSLSQMDYATKTKENCTFPTISKHINHPKSLEVGRWRSEFSYNVLQNCLVLSMRLRTNSQSDQKPWSWWGFMPWFMPRNADKIHATCWHFADTFLFGVLFWNSERYLGSQDLERRYNILLQQSNIRATFESWGEEFQPAYCNYFSQRFV